MKATKPQFLCLLRSSSVRGHIILTLAIGPKRPNVLIRKFSMPTLGERFPTYKFVVCGSPSSNDPGSFPMGSNSSGSSSKRLEDCRTHVSTLTPLLAFLITLLSKLFLKLELLHELVYYPWLSSFLFLWTLLFFLFVRLFPK
ncbi:Os02g0179950 [Oryza sativa Japonica Group]|uniref:Os02g0179950 protein n=1 Tax=Oryza sativa subsp. japonica TaxID=39947 RepID=A0A0N7KET3_ORYSJ|nr:hypothetical protein EE612_009270 [Oryza sativa]BAS77297.1 Os02g0179950 [Oryza sativa Japonica Group]